METHPLDTDTELERELLERGEEEERKGGEDREEGETGRNVGEPKMGNKIL